jgi:hypothetical protein
MAQPIHLSINVSPLHLFVAVVFSQMLVGDKINDTLRFRLTDAVDVALAAGKNLLLDSPVIALTTGLTYAVQQLTFNRPYLELSSEGAMKAAIFVGEVFALKSALTPFLGKVTKVEDKKRGNTHATMIRNTVVLHYLPVALGALYAYYNSIPVKLTQSTLYIAALIPTIKLLGKGFETFCEMEGVKVKIQEWYAWMNLEKFDGLSSGFGSGSSIL